MSGMVRIMRGTDISAHTTPEGCAITALRPEYDKLLKFQGFSFFFDFLKFKWHNVFVDVGIRHNIEKRRAP